MNNDLHRLAILLFGKVGAVVVGILFLPLYLKAVDAGTFAAIATILALQAFALLVDFGLSTLVARSVATQTRSAHGVRGTAMQAERALVLGYGIIGGAALTALPFAPQLGLSWTSALATWVFCLTSVWQNILHTALMAAERFLVATSLHVCALLIRAVLTLYALGHIEASAGTFVITHALVTTLQALVTRHVLLRRAPHHETPSWTSSLWLLRAGGSLLLSALAGASVMQLDKPLAKLGLSATQASAYFLAATLASLPIALLAAPLVQLFQPRITLALAQRQIAPALGHARRFSVMLLLVVAVPTALIWASASWLIEIWLKGNALTPQVAAIAKSLLPAFLLGGLGYLPVMLLLAHGDYRWPALINSILAIVVLASLALASIGGSLKGFALAYLAYFACAATASWWRALAVDEIRPVAKAGSWIAVPSLALLALAGWQALQLDVPAAAAPAPSRAAAQLP
ncbi:MAG: hypothetical protein JSR43_17030 [Proteobacteria bacterium]|nr:hypothetical protein [Pseudomonadota bacterium]